MNFRMEIRENDLLALEKILTDKVAEAREDIKQAAISGADQELNWAIGRLFALKDIRDIIIRMSYGIG